MKLDSKVPAGPLESKWDRHRFDLKLVNHEQAVKRVEEMLKESKALLGKRKAAREEVIAKKYEQIIGKTEHLEW